MTEQGAAAEHQTNRKSGDSHLDDFGQQPFKLVKYFTFSSLAVILFFALFLSWIISNNARKVMLNQSEEYSLVLAETLNQQVFRRFVLPMVVRYGNIALSNPEQFEALDKIVSSVIQGMNIESVTIYDSRVNIISYSTILSRVGKKDLGGIEYHKSLSGEPNSRLTSSGTVLNLLPRAPAPRCELLTFIPFRQVREDGEGSEVIMGVIEITKNLSREYTNIIRLQASIIAVSVTVMLVLFLVLRTIVSRAGNIMETRNQERQRLKEQLNQAERLAHLGTMVATVSHEIKSPLGIVRSTAEILEKRIQKVAPGNEHLARIIMDETGRLNDIVVEFLDFARPQVPKLELTDINSLVDKAVKFVSPKMKDQGIALEMVLDEQLSAGRVDVNQFYRALLNILVNSLQAMEKGGLLKVQTARADDGWIKVTVGDSGVGMSEEKLGRIFQPFFTDKHKGTGLGLAITRNIIDSHNGVIRVESEPDAGTTFTILFPAF
jgi:signal transduction histidine kinase